jgi:hypothetical protein
MTLAEAHDLFAELERETHMEDGMTFRRLHSLALRGLECTTINATHAEPAGAPVFNAATYEVLSAQPAPGESEPPAEPEPYLQQIRESPARTNFVAALEAIDELRDEAANPGEPAEPEPAREAKGCRTCGSNCVKCGSAENVTLHIYDGECYCRKCERRGAPGPMPGEPAREATDQELYEIDQVPARKALESDEPVTWAKINEAQAVGRRAIYTAGIEYGRAHAAAESAPPVVLGTNAAGEVVVARTGPEPPIDLAEYARSRDATEPCPVCGERPMPMEKTRDLFEALAAKDARIAELEGELKQARRAIREHLQWHECIVSACESREDGDVIEHIEGLEGFASDYMQIHQALLVVREGDDPPLATIEKLFARLGEEHIELSASRARVEAYNGLRRRLHFAINGFRTGPHDELLIEMDIDDAIAAVDHVLNAIDALPPEPEAKP